MRTLQGVKGFYKQIHHIQFYSNVLISKTKIGISDLTLLENYIQLIDFS